MSQPGSPDTMLTNSPETASEGNAIFARNLQICSHEFSSREPSKTDFSDLVQKDNLHRFQPSPRRSGDFHASAAVGGSWTETFERGSGADH